MDWTWRGHSRYLIGYDRIQYRPLLDTDLYLLDAGSKYLEWIYLWFQDRFGYIQTKKLCTATYRGRDFLLFLSKSSSMATKQGRFIPKNIDLLINILRFIHRYLVNNDIKMDFFFFNLIFNYSIPKIWHRILSYTFGRLKGEPKLSIVSLL